MMLLSEHLFPSCYGCVSRRLVMRIIDHRTIAT